MPFLDRLTKTLGKYWGRTKVYPGGVISPTIDRVSQISGRESRWNLEEGGPEGWGSEGRNWAQKNRVSGGRLTTLQACP